MRPARAVLVTVTVGNSVKISQAVNVDDVRKLAKRRLPRICYDFIEGGVEDEHALERNHEAFRRHALLPRYLVDVSKRNQSLRARIV